MSEGEAILTPADLDDASDGFRQPVFMPGLCSDSITKSDWSVPGLLALEPETSITVEYYADADRRKPYQLITKSFGALAGPMADEPEKWFIAERNFDETFPKVAMSLPRLVVLPSAARAVTRLVFLGTNSQSATHFHVRDQAVLVHLNGKKRVILAGPKTTDSLATNSKFGRRPQFSTHGPDAGGDALEHFGQIVGPDNVMGVDLDPGDALFIPVHWWHWVEGVGENFSVTTFWRASVREWALPHPGLRAATATVVAKLVGLARRLVSLGRRRR